MESRVKHHKIGTIRHSVRWGRVWIKNDFTTLSFPYCEDWENKVNLIYEHIKKENRPVT